MTTTPTRNKVYVWDFWVRASHLSYPLFMLALWWTADTRNFALHIPVAITFSGFVSFRLAWGFWGTRTAQFKHFLRGPRGILAYARMLFSKHPSPHTTGHNPMGGLSVISLLALMIAQISTGLFSVDTDGLNSGALAQFVSFKTGRLFGDYHELTFNILLGMVGLHLAAILGYALLKRQNLITPMVTGYTEETNGESNHENTRPTVLRVMLSLITASIVAGGLGWLQYY